MCRNLLDFDHAQEKHFWSEKLLRRHLCLQGEEEVGCRWNCRAYSRQRAWFTPELLTIQKAVGVKKCGTKNTTTQKGRNKEKIHNETAEGLKHIKWHRSSRSVFTMQVAKRISRDLFLLCRKIRSAYRWITATGNWNGGSNLFHDFCTRNKPETPWQEWASMGQSGSSFAAYFALFNFISSCFYPSSFQCQKSKISKLSSLIKEG